MAEKIYELNYYKSFLEDGKKLITSSESKKVQVNWDMLLDNKICLRVVQSNTYKNTVTISYNETICRKIFSFHIFTSFSSRGRDDWKKEIVKYGKINSGCNGHKETRFWKPGLTPEKNTTSNEKLDCNPKVKPQAQARAQSKKQRKLVYLEKMANEWENDERNLEATINELEVAESDMAAESEAAVFKLDAAEREAAVDEREAAEREAAVNNLEAAEHEAAVNKLEAAKREAAVNKLEAAKC